MPRIGGKLLKPLCVALQKRTTEETDNVLNGKKSGRFIVKHKDQLENIFRLNIITKEKYEKIKVRLEKNSSTINTIIDKK